MLTDTQRAIAVMDEAEREIFRLRAAIDPFVKAYHKSADPIGDSDLDDEQPRSVSVTMGDLRRAARLTGR
jgi:hypothetical protein